MKKATLLLLFGALAFCACRKDPVPEPPSKDADLTGQKVDVSGFPESARKLFVLNEGGMGANNATLDFLRFSDGNYITGAFKKMNPNVGAGLGDVGNDIAVHGDELWIVVRYYNKAFTLEKLFNSRFIREYSSFCVVQYMMDILPQTQSIPIQLIKAGITEHVIFLAIL